MNPSMTMWWFRILLVSSVILAIQCRYIDTDENEIIQEEKSMEQPIVELEEDDLDLEDILSDYYDDLLEELNMARHELQEQQRRITEARKKEMLLLEMTMKKKKALEDIKKKEIEYQMDYDYMSDAAATIVDSKPEDQMYDSESLFSMANNSWPFMQVNGTFEDPNLAKVQRESFGDANALNRSKEQRLKQIQDTILGLRGGHAEVNSTIPTTHVSTKTLQGIFGIKELLPSTASNTYTEKVQSFYPSCEVPRHTDEDLWTDPTSMNILFDVTYPAPIEGSAISVVAAKLRLYKINQSNSSSHVARGKQESSLFGVLPEVGTFEDDRLLRLSVYWYTRTLKKNRVKRKLIDSHMIPAAGDKWMEFNIRTAVRTWRESNRNYGLVVTVEDEDGVLLPAEKYIHAMNCSINATSAKPVPSILIDAAKQYMMEHPESNQTLNDEANTTEEVNPFQYLYPKLDISTREIPISDSNRPPPEPTSVINKKSTVDMTSNNNGYSVVLVHNGNGRINNDTKSAIQQRISNEQRTIFFNTVGLGAPAAGPNRNNLVPILTKSDVVATPEDIRMKNQLQQLNNEREIARMRHTRKHRANKNQQN